MDGLVIPSCEVEMIAVIVISEIEVENQLAVHFLEETERTGFACQEKRMHVCYKLDMQFPRCNILSDMKCKLRLRS